MCVCVCVFFQAEDGKRDRVRSRGLGDVYKRQRQVVESAEERPAGDPAARGDGLAGHPATLPGAGACAPASQFAFAPVHQRSGTCLLYTSDAADERSSVDLGGRRII